MKKIILTILISTISLSSIAAIFNMPIPQPDFVSNDWDGDGIPNSTDIDDDNDGILDDEDSLPFGQENSGESSVENGDSGLDSFASNKLNIFNGDSVSLSWSTSDLSNLTLFGGNFSNENVSNKNSITDYPTETTQYQLFTGTGSMSVDVSVDPVPITNHFTINGSSSSAEFLAGGSVVLSWGILNGKNPTISGGNLGNNVSISDAGNVTDYPTVDSIYILNNGYTTYEISANKKVIPMNCKRLSGNGVYIYAYRSNSIVNGIRHPWKFIDRGLSDSTGKQGTILKASDWSYGGYTYSTSGSASSNKYKLCRSPGWE